MSLKAFYENIHGDYNDIAQRLPSDELILYFIKQFPLDRSYDELIDAVQKGNIKESFMSAHNLKGFAANLSFSELFDSLKELSEQLRNQTEPANEELVKNVTRCYNIILHEIGNLK